MVDRVAEADGSKKANADNPTFLNSEEIGMAVLEILVELD
jgi:hypothetical protein